MAKKRVSKTSKKLIVKKDTKKLVVKIDTKKPLVKKGKISQGLAIAALLLNILILPGLGSLIGGRTKAGVWQLVLAIGGGLLSIILIGIPFVTAGWIWGLVIGIPFVIAGWILGLATGIQLINESG